MKKMKLWRWFKKCPMLFLLLAGWGSLTAYTWSQGRLPHRLEKDIIEKPVFTALLEKDASQSMLSELDEQAVMAGIVGLDDDEPGGTEAGAAGHVTDKESGMEDAGTETAGAEDGQTDNADNTDSSRKDASGSDAAGGASGSGMGADKDSTDKKNEGPAPDGPGEKEKNSPDAVKQADETAGVTRFEKCRQVQTDSQYYSDPGKRALTTEYAYQKVGKSYFDDAVFIGDSRTVGMQDYSGLDNAQFFAKTGLNVYEVLEDKFIEDPQTGEEVSVSHMLKAKKYGKIYFMVGINELGTGNTGTFQKAYERVLRKFQKWQPDAVIYIQGIIPVSKEKSSQDAIFNNVNINDKNVAIAQLADGRDIFYLDVSSSLTDKNGHLKKDYTFDDIHMYAQHYGLWTEYLMKHAVVR